MIRNESEILNVGMASRPAGGLRGVVTAPARYVAEHWSKKYVSKMKKKYFI